ncbi:MAG: nuclease-related domain-containing protein [bacterium]
MTDTHNIIMLITLMTLVVIGVFVVIVLRRRRANARGLQPLVRQLAHDALIHVVISDGNQGEIYIDHLLLTPQGLLVLDSIDAAGNVFAGDRMDTWSATDNGTRVNFRNPIPALADRVSAVKGLAPTVPVASYVVFTADVQFPKGHPQNVTTVAHLLETFPTGPAASAQMFEPHWTAIKAAAKPLS